MTSTSPSLSPGGRRLDDRLSPILVKELRQGMRARVFLLSFLLLQVFLVVLVLYNLAAQGDYNALSVSNGFFWVIIGFALLVLMPLRGLVAVSQEVKNHTMETIMLTRLTAWRVVFGKWSALFAQSLLLVSAVLPYVVLRYFIGGDDVVSDFKWILFMLWLSGILIAASIAVSGLSNPVIRIAVVVGVVVTVIGGSDSLSSSGFSREDVWGIIGWLLSFGFFIPALLFELTASGIAPVSENHAVRRRLLALAFFGVAVGLTKMTHNDFPAGIEIPLIILISVCYFDLAEKPRLLPRLIQPLARRGVAGRIAALFLLPGWPTAMLFSLVAIPLAMGIADQFIPPDAKIGWVLPIMAVWGSILTPILICHLFWRKMNQVLLIVLLYNVILMAIASLLEGFASLTHSRVDEVLALTPSYPVLMITSDSENAASMAYFYLWYLLGHALVLTLLILVLLLASRPYFRELSSLFRSVKSVQPSPDNPEPAPATP
jgi:hypothetical protein